MLGECSRVWVLNLSDAMSSSESADMTQEELLENFHLMAPSDDDTHILWNAISNYMNSGTQVDTWKVRPGRVSSRAGRLRGAPGINAFLPKAGRRCPQ